MNNPIYQYIVPAWIIYNKMDIHIDTKCMEYIYCKKKWTIILEPAWIIYKMKRTIISILSAWDIYYKKKADNHIRTCMEYNETKLPSWMIYK